MDIKPRKIKHLPNSEASEFGIKKLPSSALELGSFAVRLKGAIGKRSVRAFASACNLSDGAVRQYLSGKSEPSRVALLSMAQVLEVPLAWLAAGEESSSIAAQEEQAPYKRRTDDQYEYIPLYDVRASAGHGAMIDQERIVDSLAFKSDWVRVNLGACPEDLYLIKVEGESMEPTLRPGDVILVDHRAAESLPREGIYVLRMDSTLLVKRLRKLPGGIIEVASDNPAYSPFMLRPDEPRGDLEIIGRVVWCGRRM